LADTPDALAASPMFIMSMLLEAMCCTWQFRPSYCGKVKR
jgi:hypothetical protein